MQTNGDLTHSNGHDRSQENVPVIASAPHVELLGARSHSVARHGFADEAPQNQQLRSLLSALRRRWFVAISLGLLLGGAAGTAAWYFVPTLYTATGELRIEIGRGDAPWNATGRWRLENPETFRMSMMQRVKEPFVLNRALREPNVANCLTLQLQEFKDIWLQKALEVKAVGAMNIRVSLSGDRPSDLPLIVNAVLNAFIAGEVDEYDKDRKARLAEVKSVYAKDSARRAELKDQVQALNRRIQTGNATDNQLQRQLRNDIFVQLRREFGELRMVVIQKKAQLASLQGESPETVVGNLDIPTEVIDAELAKDRGYAELAVATARQKSLVAQYEKVTRPENDQRKAAEEKLKSLEDQLQSRRDAQLPAVRKKLLEWVSTGSTAPSSADQLRAEIASLAFQEAEYERQLKENELESSTVGSLMLDQQELMQELADMDLDVKALEADIRKRELELEYDKPPIRKYVDAEVPRMPDEAKRVKTAGLAGAGVFGAIAALIVWLEMLTQRISTAAEVEQRLRLPVVGRIPLMPSSIAKSRAGKSNAKTAYWHSVLTESVDSARTMLLRLAKIDGVKTVMIASATGGEGKTTLTCHLATSLARAGRRVLLMDCDVRAPSVHEVFDIPNLTGFCEVIGGEVPLASAIVPSPQAGLFILPAGQLDQTTLQQLALDQFGPLLAEAAQDFDFVIVDSAPILPVTDSLMLAPHMDGIIMSVRRDVSRMTKVAAAVQRLMMLGAPILGVVTIGLEDAEQSYYYSRYSTYHPRDRRLSVDELQSAET